MAKCSKMVYPVRRFGRSVSCQRNGKLEHEGNLYCSQHYPPNVQARDEAMRAKWKAESDARMKAFERESLIRELTKDFTTEQLQEIKNNGGFKI
jgi:hypothetical protein